MNRNIRTLLVVASRSSLPALASLGVYRAIQRIPVREVPVAHHYAVVAARALTAGATVSKDDVKLVPWPASASDARWLHDDRRGDQSRSDRLASPRTSRWPRASWRRSTPAPGSPPTIPPGMRAISVKVNEVIGVAGFTVPGTRVDVLVTVRKTNRQAMSASSSATWRC